MTTRSKLQKRKDNPASRYHKKRADAAWRMAVLAAWGHCCAVCQGTPAEAHHLISRSRLALRHMPENGIALCANHHKWHPICSAHSGPFGFVEWLRTHHWGIYEWVQSHKWTPNLIKPDYRAAVERLTQKGTPVFVVGDQAS